MGYREGLEHGKLQHMQKGFDEGYNAVGVPLGRALGELRGCADALFFAVSRRESKAQGDAPDEPSQSAAQKRLQDLCTELASIKLEDVAEPDWDVIQHDLEHHSSQDPLPILAKKRAEYAEQGDRISALRERLDTLERELLSPSP